MASPVKSHTAAAAQTPSQPSLAQAIEMPGLPRDQPTSATEPPGENEAQNTRAQTLLQAHIQQFPNLNGVMTTTDGSSIIDMWHGYGGHLVPESCSS